MVAVGLPANEAHRSDSPARVIAPLYTFAGANRTMSAMAMPPSEPAVLVPEWRRGPPFASASTHRIDYTHAYISLHAGRGARGFTRSPRVERRAAERGYTVRCRKVGGGWVEGGCEREDEGDAFFVIREIIREAWGFFAQRDVGVGVDVGEESADINADWRSHGCERAVIAIGWG